MRFHGQGLGGRRGSGGEHVGARAAAAEQQDQREGEDDPAALHLREGARRKDQLRIRLDRVQWKVLQGEGSFTNLNIWLNIFEMGDPFMR